MVTRSLVIDFIRYLRNKENVIIDPYITRTMFKSNVDRTDTVIKLLEKIKNADDEFVAYGITARSICHSANTNWKLCPHISYHEDLYEYLLEIGYEDEEATFYTKVVAGGNYKDYIKQKAKCSWFKGNLHNFALSCKCLPHRETFIGRFPTEYGLFKKSI